MAAKRYSLVFYAALAVALGATYGVYRVIEATKAGNRITTAPVAVAAQDIPQGEIIDRIAVTIAQWPVATVPPGAYARLDSVAGRVARVEIFKGEPLVPGRLAPEGTAPGLQVKITPGKRAMGLRINDVSGMSGMIQPNSRVDILLTLNAMGSDSRRSAKLFMSNMRVLAIGSDVQPGDDGRPITATVATLEVFPDEGEKLGVAQVLGQIQLMLRGYGDPDSINTKGATTSDVTAMLRDYVPPRTSSPPRQTRPAPQPKAAEPAPVVAPAPPIIPRIAAKPETTTVPVFRAGKKSEEKFKKDSVRRDTTVKN